MQFIDLLNQRSSYYDYDADEIITPAIIEALVAEAIKAPSAYHMQNWYFIAVTSKEAKQKLYDVAYQQEKIKKAAVTFIVCGDIDGYQHLEAALQPSIHAGHFPQVLANSSISNAHNSHATNLPLQRDEAIRSASLASMVLMLAAENMGYATGAMSGFEPDKLQATFNLAPTRVPVMLITVGSPTSPRYPQKQRLPVTKKLCII
ncbi:nitroreductase family protein [Psychrobacter sp. I-STPA10]|uniref:nitroreductase family protein n=1 Tax=Psychrobacter sp. I-STPA10 TaxID=2585769 RepID=UPI001E33401F|nr:nitroreductase family protein [Psychrobacter sp. I-STPA10]